MIDYFITQLEMHCPAPIVRNIKNIDLFSSDSEDKLIDTSVMIEQPARKETHDYSCLKAYVGYMSTQITAGMPEEVYSQWLDDANSLAKQDKTTLYAAVQRAMGVIPIDSVNLSRYLIAAGLYQFPLPPALENDLKGKPIVNARSLITSYASYLMIIGDPEGLRLLDEAAYRLESDVNELGFLHDRIDLILDSYSLKREQVEGLIKILSRYENDNRAADGVDGPGTGIRISVAVKIILEYYQRGSYGFKPTP